MTPNSNRRDNPSWSMSGHRWNVNFRAWTKCINRLWVHWLSTLRMDWWIRYRTMRWWNNLITYLFRDVKPWIKQWRMCGSRICWRRTLSWLWSWRRGFRKWSNLVLCSNCLSSSDVDYWDIHSLKIYIIWNCKNEA